MSVTQQTLSVQQILKMKLSGYSKLFKIFTLPQFKEHLDNIILKFTVVDGKLDNFTSILQNYHIYEEEQKHIKNNLGSIRENLTPKERELFRSNDETVKIFMQIHPTLTPLIKASCYISATKTINKKVDEAYSFPIIISHDSVKHTANNPSEYFNYKVERCNKSFNGTITSIDHDIAQYVSEQSDMIGKLEYKVNHDGL